MHREKRKEKEKENKYCHDRIRDKKCLRLEEKGTYEAFVPFVAMGTWLDNLFQLGFFLGGRRGVM